MNDRNGLISRRGAWRESFQVYSPTGDADPTLHAYRLLLWPASHGCGPNDYGWYRSTAPDGLDAASNDGTGRLVAVANGTGVVLTWLFRVDAVQGLEPGGYTGAILAAPVSDPSNPTEIQTFSRVVR